MSDAPAAEPRRWQRLIESGDADPLEVLRTVGTYQRYLEAIETRAVRTARGLGRSWEEVAGALGVKRQSAWAKHGRPMGRSRQVADRIASSQTGVLLRCPGCGADKELKVKLGDPGQIAVFDPGADEHFVLPGPVLWTCPTCGREQSALVEVKGARPSVLWELPG